MEPVPHIAPFFRPPAGIDDSGCIDAIEILSRCQLADNIKLNRPICTDCVEDVIPVKISYYPLTFNSVCVIRQDILSSRLDFARI